MHYVLFAAIFIFTVGCSTRGPNTSQPTNSRISTVQYATSATESGQKPLSLDLYLGGSSCTAPRPTLMFIHGGAFKNGDKAAARGWGVAQAFTAAGMNVVSIQYRLDGYNPVPSQPYLDLVEEGSVDAREEQYEGQLINVAAALEDANKALKFIVANAAQACIDTNEIFLMGTSAGAVTSLNVAYSFDEAGISRPSIQGVVDLWGTGLPTDAIDAGSVPLFIAHGERDRTAPFVEAVANYDRARAVGVPTQLHAFIDEGHGFNLNETKVNGVSVMDLAIDFVQDIAAGRSIETIRTRN